jgi:hypothetical protein
VKKLIASMGVAIFVTVGGTALANERSPTDYIKDLIDSIVSPLIFNVEETIQENSQGYANELSILVEASYSRASIELSSWKESELARVNRELSTYYAVKSAEIKDAAKKEIRAGKSEITKQLNAGMAEEKAKIDAALKASNGEIKGGDVETPILVEPPIEQDVVESEEGSEEENVQDGSELIEHEENEQTDTNPTIETSELDG